MSAANSAAVKKGDDKVETQSLKELLLGNARSYGIFFALVVVIIVFQILTGGRLLNPNNVVALFQQNAYVLIAAIGMLMVIIATHIDLSVGSVVAFIGGVGALAMKNWGLNWFLAIVLFSPDGLLGLWATLRARFGERSVVTDAADIAPWLTDWRGRWTGMSAAILQPGTTEEVAAMPAMPASSSATTSAGGTATARPSPTSTSPPRPPPAASRI